MARVLFGHHVAHAAADQQRRHAKGARGAVEPVGVAARVDAAVAGHEPRVPVPAVAAVGTEAQVLPQAGEVLRSRPMADVGRDGLGRLLERREAVGVARHERHDPLDALRLHARRDVHEHHGRRAGRRGLALGDERRKAAERRADQRGAPTEACGDGAHVGGEGIHRVIAVGRPAALAVPAEIEGDGVEAPLGERGRGAAPGVPRLPAAVEEEHGPARRVAVGVRRELEPVRDVEGEAPHESRCTVSGENAGRHTAMYSAPSGPGELYWTHSPRRAMTASPARTSIVPPSCVTRSMPPSTTVYSSNAGRCPGSTHPLGLRMCATLTAAVPEFTRPTYSSIAFGGLPAATMRVGDGR